MNSSSVSTVTEQSTCDYSDEALSKKTDSVHLNTSLMDNESNRHATRSSFKNSASWTRKRALMQRSYQWTATLEQENSMNKLTKTHVSNNTNQQNLPLYSEEMTTNTKSNSFNHIPSNLVCRRHSSRRLPQIPLVNDNQKNSSKNDELIDDIRVASPLVTLNQQSHQSSQENSFDNYGNRSKSIVSESLLEGRTVHTKLLPTNQIQNVQSIDPSNIVREKPSLAVNGTPLPQCSFDYPCIVRKMQDLSNIIRTQMLYSKLTKQQQRSVFSESLEREHVPKVPRKIIIRQNNSIEIALR